MEAAQAIQFRRQPGQAIPVLFETRFNELDVFAGVLFLLRQVGQVIVDQLVGHRGAEQAGQIGFQLVAQSPQGIGAGFRAWQVQIAQRHFHFPGGGDRPQRLAHGINEIVHALRFQFPAIGAAEAVHGAGFGGVFF